MEQQAASSPTLQPTWLGALADRESKAKSCSGPAAPPRRFCARTRSGSVFRFLAVVPKCSLPPSNDAVVAADRALPDHSIQIQIKADLQHPGARPPPWSATTAKRDRRTEVGSLSNDLREVLRQNSATRRQSGECPCRRQIVPKIDAPRVSHLQLPVRHAPFTRGRREKRYALPLDLSAATARSSQLICWPPVGAEHRRVRPAREHAHALQPSSLAAFHNRMQAWLQQWRQLARATALLSIHCV